MATPNYRVVLSFDRDRQVFQARAPELPHCTGEGGSRAEAIARLEEEIQAQVENMRAHGGSPPASVDEEVFSGALSLNLSQGLHRDLVWQARQEGIEPEQLVAEMLAAAVESRRGVRHRSGNRQQEQHNGPDNVGNSGNGNFRGNNRNAGQRYNTGLLDDRANFIEYVRNLEHNGQSGGPQGPGGNNNRRRRRGRGGAIQGGGGPNRT